jgi:hypothetical protein
MTHTSMSPVSELALNAGETLNLNSDAEHSNTKVNQKDPTHGPQKSWLFI